MAQLPYSLGAPVWACEAWVGSLYSTKNRRRWLAEYSQVFNAVEGNSTFYGLPTVDTVRGWAAESAPGFEFCFKFPGEITHENRLVAAERKTAEFLEMLHLLHEAGRLGPSFLQLPPFFDGTQFAALETYLCKLPHDFPYAVEVRHADYFDQGPSEARLDNLLRELAIDRVLFDSRALYSQPPTDHHERKSQGRKPKSPLRRTATSNRPMVRFIGRNDLSLLGPWIQEWATQTAEWLHEGKKPLIFAHTPNDEFAPGFAEAFHAVLREQVPGLSQLPEWPGKTQARQQSLF